MKYFILVTRKYLNTDNLGIQFLKKWNKNLEEYNLSFSFSTEYNMLETIKSFLKQAQIIHFLYLFNSIKEAQEAARIIKIHENDKLVLEGNELTNIFVLPQDLIFNQDLLNEYVKK